MNFEPYLLPEQLDPIDRFCKWFAIIAGSGLLLFWFRTGFAQDYWTKAYEPAAVRDVIEVEFPCGRRDLYGCVERATGLIFIRPDLRPILRECVLSHEYKHMAGYVHPEPRGREFATDCSDGSMVLR